MSVVRARMAVVTSVAVTLPLWVAFSVLGERITPRMQSLPTVLAVLLGVTMLMTILAVPAVLWAAVLARTAALPRRPVTSTTLRTALPMAAVVGLLVDASQLFIDVVAPWFDLAVHVLFAVAFAGGLSLFFGVLTTRLVRTVPIPAGPRAVPTVVAACCLGVAAGALMAVPLGWEVRQWMGPSMLVPLYLVLATGSAAAGAALGHVLQPPTSTPPVT